LGTSLNLSERNSKTIGSPLRQAESRTGQQQKCRIQECDSRENSDKKNTRRNMETDVAIQKRHARMEDNGSRRSTKYQQQDHDDQPRP